MPRVLITTSTLPRWDGDFEARFVLDLARHLPGAWEPTLLAPAYPGAVRHESLDGVPVVRYHYAPLARWETLCYPGSILSRLGANPWHWGLVPALVFGLRRAVAAQLAAGPCDCVHAHWLFPQGLTHALGFARRRHPPLVVTSHGGDLGLARRREAIRPLLRRVVRRADVLTLVSSGLREPLALCDPEYPQGRVPVIPMGVDVRRFRPTLRDPAWVATRGLAAPVVLFVGRLVEKKGVATLLDAFAVRPLKDTRATLAICGDGPLAGALRQRAETLGIAGRVRFLGPLGHAELAVAYASCDILCTPSVEAANGDLDGVPTVLPEAAAAGLALVGSDLAGIPEVVIPGRTGLLVPPGNAVALARALATLVQDQELRERLATGARDHAAAFAWDVIAGRFAAVYADAVERRARGVQR